MRRTRQSGYIMRRRGWWVLRYRERVSVGGNIKTVQRAKRLAPVDPEHKTKASVRDLATQELDPLNRNVAEPLRVTKLGDFVTRIYLPFVKQQKRPSTFRGYSQMWSDYVEPRCKAEWLREIKTHHVQTNVPGRDCARAQTLQNNSEAREKFPEWHLSTRGTAGLFRRIKSSEACRDPRFRSEWRRNKTLFA